MHHTLKMPVVSSSEHDQVDLPTSSRIIKLLIVLLFINGVKDIHRLVKQRQNRSDIFRGICRSVQTDPFQYNMRREKRKED